MTAPRLFVFGLGYSASVFARAMKGKAGWIGGTVRSADKAERLRAEGIDAVVFDGSAPTDSAGEALAEATHLLMSIAPGDGDPVLAHHRADIAAARHLRWIGYLSTVGVYGDHGGAWVDEDTEPRPARGRSTARLAAERAWGKLAGECGIPLAILRIAGIYGPGRNALVNLAEGKARRIVKPGQVFNRIHVDDIAAALIAAIDRDAGGIFNLADDEPSPPQDVVAFAAGLMGIEPPPEILFAEADLSPMARSFYGENKRVANGRIKRELGILLRYPTYREGLTALWSAARDMPA
jgi:nucleoside-diphosphate-sugar epimerase